MDETGGNEVRAVAGIEAVQIRGVLEVVGVELAVFKSGVGQNVIIENNDLEIVAFLGEEGLDLLKDLGVRGGGSADGDGLFRGGLFGRGFGRSFRSGSFGSGGGFRGGRGGGGAAGGQREQQRESEDNRKNLFHFDISPFRLDSVGETF